MERTLQKSSIDSFSYAQDGSSFIEMDPKLFSKRWKNDSFDFDFHLQPAQSAALVHADEIISDGLLLPLYLVRPPKTEAVSNALADSALMRSLSIDSSKSFLSQSNRLESCHGSVSSNSSPLCGPVAVATLSSGSSKSELAARRSSTKLLQKCLCFMLPFYKKVKRLVLTRKAMCSTVSCMESIGSSPGLSDTFSSFESFRDKAMLDAGTETAIYDAVLHCKNSFVKS